MKPVTGVAGTSQQLEFFMRCRVLAILALLAVVLASAASAQDRDYVNGRSASDADVPPFSGAVWVGPTLYLSGTLGLGPDRSVPATATEEAHNVLGNMKAVLEEAGLTMDDLVSVQIFSSDVSDYDAFNAVYRTYFTQTYPARAFIGAGTLLFGARFEVMGIATRAGS
jgi:2-iminobutanoate/2-iminopropanoate deaminase